jgi:uncharacterized protein (DUF1800 family)
VFLDNDGFHISLIPLAFRFPNPKKMPSYLRADFPWRRFIQTKRATGLLAMAVAFGGSVSMASATLDLNANGLADVWEEKFRASLLVADDDEDGDGVSNADECRAGTNPWDPGSLLAVCEMTSTGGVPALGWYSQPGKAYRVLSTTDLALGDWTPVTAYRTADGAVMEEVLSGLPDAGGTRFFRVAVKDVDTDNDGVPDWDEHQLPGFDPLVKQSKVAGLDDLQSLENLLDGGGNTVSVSSVSPMAFEKEAVDGKIRISRSGGLRALAIHFSLTGNTNIQKGSALPADYELRDEAGGLIASPVQLPFGVEFLEVYVRPLADSLTETPELLTLTINAHDGYQTGGSASAAVTISDASNVAANERLFVAYLVPESGSSATGLATVRLKGDNASGTLSLSFSGLTSPQTTSILELGNGGAGSYIKGLPGGQVASNTWTVKAAAFLTTDQEMLEALFAGNVSAAVNTTNFLEGEIRGNFVLSTGTTEPPLPEVPPEYETLAGEALKRDVARFLTQATFGPKESDITALINQIENTHAGDRIAGYRAWVQNQFALDQTSLEAYTRAADTQEFFLLGTDPVNYTSQGGANPGTSNRRRAWWTVSAGAHDQLRQRLAFALSQIFVISEKTTEINNRHYALANYYDQLGARSTGNFRNLLDYVSKSPMMGSYLSHLKNQKATYHPTTGAVIVSPDENYAREIMQLFTIGLVALHPDGSLKLDADGLPIPTYSNADITELARIFTGWSFSRRHGSKAANYPEEENTNFNQSSGPAYFQASWLNPMKNFATYHDTGAKTVLGQPIPAGLDGQADLDAAHDILFHHDNVGPFISRLLIQRLVTSTPSSGYLYRVAQKFADDGTGVRGNLAAVVEAILLDPEARNLTVADNVGFGKQKEPIVRYMQLIRAYDAASQLPISDLSAFGFSADQLNNYPAGATRLRYSNSDNAIGQSPQASPTVFNWYQSGYSPGGAITEAGLVAPEMQITNETQVVTAINFSYTLVNSTNGQSGTTLPGASTALDDVRVSRVPWENFYTAEIAAGKTPIQAITALVDRLDLLLMGGRLKSKYGVAPLPNPRSSIIDSATRLSTTSTADRITNVLYLMSNTPEFLHQK